MAEARLGPHTKSETDYSRAHPRARVSARLRTHYARGVRRPAAGGAAGYPEGLVGAGTVSGDSNNNNNNNAADDDDDDEGELLLLK